jgi:hypothetical protein
MAPKKTTPQGMDGLHRGLSSQRPNDESLV